ncbi:hypothetical protein COP2_020300 [Malus domestica]
MIWRGGLKRLIVAYFYRGNRHDGWIYYSRNCFLLIFTDCIELARYRAKRDERERQEEVHFKRAPITKKEKQREKHLKKSRNGLLGLTDNFYDEIKGLPLDDENDEQVASFSSARGGMGRHKKHKDMNGYVIKAYWKTGKHVPFSWACLSASYANHLGINASLY